MAHIVCQVLQRRDRITFIWSQGTASFPPYHLGGEQAEQFRRLSRDVWDALAQTTLGPTTLLAAAQSGWRLYQAIFPADPIASEIRGWLHELHGRNEIDSLEIATDLPGVIPFHAIYEQPPDESAFREGRPDAMQPFWGVRYPLTTGRRANTWRQVPSLDKPQVLLAIDPVLRELLPPEDKTRLADLIEAKGLEIVESKSALESILQERPPDILYMLCRPRADGFGLGNDTIQFADLRNYARAAEAEPLIFLTVGETGVPDRTPAATYSSQLLAWGLDGLIVTEQPVPGQGPSLGLEFLTHFVYGGETLGAFLQKLRSHVKSGLLVSSSCPAHLRVHWQDIDTEESPIDTPEPGPLPEKPYCPLMPYDREQRALFAGRDHDLADFALRLDRAGTRLIFLHGVSGGGKSSFLHAAVVPFLEDEAIGFHALRDRSPDEDAAPTSERDYPVLAIRATHDLAGQLAEALCAFCSQPYSFVSPTGKSTVVDLPGILRRMTGVSGSTSEAVREMPGSDHIKLSAPEVTEPQRPATAEPGAGDEVTPEVVWQALVNDPGLLGRLLSALSESLPFEPVILVEQGEEIFTQAFRAVDRRRRAQALEMLARYAACPARCKLIYALRTEHLGRLLEELPRQDSKPDTFALPLLPDQAIVEAIMLPALNEPIPYSAQIPYEKYRFTFDEGIPELILDRVRSFGGTEQLLSRVQTTCAQLYEMLGDREDRVVRAKDVNLLAKKDSAFELGSYAEKKLGFLTRKDRGRFKQLCQHLYQREALGTVSRRLVPIQDLAAHWRTPTPLEPVIESAAADDVRLLEVNQLLVGGEEGLYVSLAHDGLALAASQWSEESRRRAYARTRIVDLLWVFVPLLFLVGALAHFWTRQSAASEDSMPKSEVKKIFDKVQEAFEKGLQKQAKGLQYSSYLGHLALAEEAGRADNALRMRQLLLADQDRGKESLRGFEWFYLWGRAMQERRSLHGHKGLITSVAVAGNGETIASASVDGTVKVWDGSGTIRATLQGHTGPVHAVAISPDGKTLASAGADKTVQLWDIPAGADYLVIDKARKKLTGHNAEVLALAFAPKTQLLASGGEDKTIIVWDTFKGEKQRSFKEHAGSVLALAFAPDGKTLASAGNDHKVFTWDVSSGTKRSFDGHGGPVFAVAFSPDGERFASGGAEPRDNLDVGRVFLWDVKTGKRTADRIEHSMGVFTLAFGADGILFSGGKDNLIRASDSANGHELGRLRGHFGWVRTLALTANGRALVSGGYDQTVKLWDPAAALNSDVIHAEQGAVCSLAFSANDKVLASGGQDGTVNLWNVERISSRSEEQKGESHTFAKLNGPVLSVAFSPAGGSPRLAAGTWTEKGEGEIRIWEMQAAKPTELHRLKSGGGIACLAFSRDGKVLASGGSENVTLWDVATGKEQHVLKGHKGGVRALSFSFKNNLLATAGDDKTIHIWDADTGKEKRPPLEAHTAAVTGLAYFADGWLISAGLDQTIQLWKPDGTNESSWRGHSNAILALVNHPRRQPGEWVFSGSWDQTVKAWGLRHSEERFTFIGHTGPVRALALTSDAGTLASGSSDGTIRFWRTASPAVLGPDPSLELQKK